MGYFIAYRHTGADPKRLGELLPAVKSALEDAGHETYCTYFNEDSFRSRGFGPKEIMLEAFSNIDRLGSLFVVVDGSEKSEGMLLEAGYCLAKGIPFVVAKRTGADSYLDALASQHIQYDDVNDLVQKIKEEL